MNKNKIVLVFHDTAHASLPLFPFWNLYFRIIWSSKSKIRIYNYFVHLEILQNFNKFKAQNENMKPKSDIINYFFLLCWCTEDQIRIKGYKYTCPPSLVQAFCS